MRHKSTKITQFRLYWQITLWQYWIDFKWWIVEWYTGETAVIQKPFDKSNPPRSGSRVPKRPLPIVDIGIIQR